MSIANKLTYLNATKTALATAINAALGGSINDATTFRQYASQVALNEATLRLLFDAGLYGAGATHLTRNDSLTLTGAIPVTRSTGGGRFDQLGNFEWVGVDVPRLDHDPATLSSSSSTVTIGMGYKTFAVTRLYPVGQVVVASADLSNFVVGYVVASASDSVTVNVARAVGSGSHSSWTVIRALGLLMEEQRTNLLTSVASAGWTITRMSATAGVSGGSIGEGAFTLTEDSTTGNRRLGLNTQLAATACTASLYVKPKGRTEFMLQVQRAFGSSPFPTFRVSGDIATGVLQTLSTDGAELTSAYVEAMAGGWYRIVLSGKPAIEGLHGTSFFMRRGGQLSYQGDGVSGMEVFGFQLEVGSFPTSHIPTSDSAVTRAGDNPVRTLSTEYNPDQGRIELLAQGRTGETLLTLGSRTIVADSNDLKLYTLSYDTDPSATTLVLGNGRHHSLRYYPEEA